MKKQTLLPRIFHWLARFCELQLFLSLVSLPFLIAWGLPLSLASPIANLIFSPILTLFLLISSLLFFTELLFIPNAWLAQCLNVVTRWWLWLLNWHHHSWLVGFIKPPLWTLFFIPVGAAFIIYRYNRCSMRKIKYLALLLVVIYIALHMHGTGEATILEIPCHNANVTVIINNRQTILIDSGVIGQRASANSWISFTLVPYLTQTTGHLQIDHIIALQPGARTFEALTLLSRKMHIKRVYLPYWDGTLSRSAWRAFFALREQLKETDCILIRMAKRDYRIKLSQNNSLQIEPLEQQLKYQDATYPAFHVHGQIDNESFDIYAAKHKKSRPQKRNTDDTKKDCAGSCP